MNALAIDLGGKYVGYAYLRAATTGALVELISAGTWDIESKRKTSPGVRWLKLRAELDSVLDISGLPVDLVLYEEVNAHTSRYPGKGGRMEQHFNVAAAHVYGAGEGQLLAFCAARELEVTSVTIGDVKRAAVGKGGGKGTDKDAVLAAARRLWPGIDFPTPDAADAAFIGLAGLADLGYKIPSPGSPAVAAAPVRKVKPAPLFDDLTVGKG